MKCSYCGKEFGKGTNCQNCGVDRVTGLGNYSGYDRPTGSYDYSVHSPSNNGGISPNTTVCYACGEIIPANSDFCPICGRKLLVKCPNCGFTYSSQYKICSKCGTNIEHYYKQKEEERQTAIREEKERKKHIEQERKRKEDKESPIGCFLLILIGGFFVFGFLLSELIDKDFLNIEVLSINIRTALLGCISFGASFLCASIWDKIMEEIMED